VEEKKQNRFPKRWDADRVRAVLEHYEYQSEKEAVEEDEAADRNHAQLDGSVVIFDDPD
jgi:hypothetical protein